MVSGEWCNPGTNSASLSVNQSVAVSGSLVNVTNCPGTSASFNVSATGTGLSYQWYKGGSALIGKTSSNLSFNGISATDAGTYSVAVSGSCGTPLTNSATLTILTNVSATPLSNLINCPGSSANFNVSATGTSLSYQWYKG